MKNGSVDDKKLIRQTVSSHQNVKVKHDDGMTTSCRARDTAGGGRVAFSNAYGDLPMIILQPMTHEATHTPQRRQLAPLTRPPPQQHGKKEDKAAAANKKENHPETPFDVVQKTQDA